MGRVNIQHPVTKMWRCFSSVVDDWVSDWMTEADYKQWLIDEQVREMQYNFEHFGIQKPRMTNYNEVVYTAAFKKMCDKCKDMDCDHCKYNVDLDTYIENKNDYLNIFNELDFDSYINGEDND